MATQIKLSVILQTLKLLDGFGNKKVFQLVNKIGLNSFKGHSMESLIELFNEYNNSNSVQIPIGQLKNNLGQAFDIHKDSEEFGIKELTLFDEKYPDQLRDLTSPPLILYYRGNINCLFGNNNTAVIGSRNTNPEIMKLTEDYSYYLASNNKTIVSGLAKGCDTAGHKGALKAKGKTIAVLPCGLDDLSIAPKENLALALEILSGKGCLVSEYPIHHKATKYTFVERDRIQSGLSQSVLIMQTTQDGGTMHTYKYAKDQNRIIACYGNDIEGEEFSGNRTIIENQQDIITIKSLKDLDKLFNSKPQTLF
jgi:DNA processing protein